MKKKRQEDPQFKFKKVWAWPESTERFIHERCKGFVLNVCSGESDLGDVTIDLNTKADIKADMYHLPIKPNSVDTLVCDPPWKLPYHLRPKLIFELVDAIKEGGTLIFNAPWLPKAKGLRIDSIYVGIPTPAWRTVDFIIIGKKYFDYHPPKNSMYVLKKSSKALSEVFT